MPQQSNPSERINFLVIHGIGQQEPYETLDQFIRKRHNELVPQPTHHRPEAS
ncbi:MAG TPA: hypothetical protein VFC39_18165 [Acidobacteriaceae bacterium]|jgi:hypothetical protein|nr:hypothetical protein [Acidobacteriaceae bacterium]